MVTLRSKGPISDVPTTCMKKEYGETSKISEYEHSREERIKENLQRMQKLGILDLSLKLKSLNKSTPKSNRAIRLTLDHSTPRPRRRSSRLQNATPVCYSELHLKDDPLKDEHDLLREDGSKPEVYTEEHERLLGSTEMSWTLFVDGCGRDGKRIYDQVNGKTCHQCRQKTLGYRTHCCKCNKVQGQFCGDCLYMRYGEHVLEANQNPNWVCPVCRGICNCSLCRQAKGWPPTGSLYRKISSLGFKSVAHYIIQTRRSNSDSEANSVTKVPISVKRSLPFSTTEATSLEKESSEFNTKPHGSEYDQSDSHVTENCLDVGKQEGKPRLSDNKLGDCKVNLKSNSELIMEQAFATNGDSVDPVFLGVIQKEIDWQDCSNIPLDNIAESLNKLGLPKTSFDQKGASKTECGTSIDKLKGTKGDAIFHLGKRNADCFAAPESSLNVKKKHGHTNDLSTDSIAGRLRQRRNKSNELSEQMSRGGAKIGTSDVKLELSNVMSPGSTTPDVTAVAVGVADSISRRLGERHGKDKEHEEQRSTGVQQLNNVPSLLKAEGTLNQTDSANPGVAPVTLSKSYKEHIHVTEPSHDSIAGRLRQRRSQGRVL